MSHNEEGVIKYTSSHAFCSSEEVLSSLQKTTDPRCSETFAELDAARTTLHDLGLIGVSPSRLEEGSLGIGYGNISMRVSGNCFLISGSGTGGSRILGTAGYSLVHAFSPEENRVSSRGPVRASSESMTHGAMYRASAALLCVIHVHNRELFDRLLEQNWMHTPASAAYGTPALSLAMETLVRTLPETGGVVVTTGHDAGLFACGPTVQHTLENLVQLYTLKGTIKWTSR